MTETAIHLVSDVAIGELDESVLRYARAAKAPNTVRGYRSDLRDFDEWCAIHELEALPAPPATVAAYLSWLADGGATAATIQRRISAISQAHKLAGHPSPTQEAMVRQTNAGIRRTIGVRPTRKKPATAPVLRQFLATTPADTLAGRRDRALFLVGFAGAFRRSELVALDVGDLEETEDGLRIHVRRSKTDQEGEGDCVGIPYGQHPETCPIRAVRAWCAHAGIYSGPVFRAVDRHGNVAQERMTDQSVALIIKRAARRAELPVLDFAGHSLRAGLATTAAAGGAPERSIMRQGRWTSADVMRRYIRPATVFEENAVAYCGL